MWPHKNLYAPLLSTYNFSTELENNKEKGGTKTKRATILVAFSLMLTTILIAPAFAINTRPTIVALPTITIISPQNQTYTGAVPMDIPLTFEIMFDVNNKNGMIVEMAYSLDGGDNSTVSGNSTISVSSYGHHNITVYATNVFGDTYGSEIVYFTVSIVGDLDGNGEVGITDILLAIAAFRSIEGESNWNPLADVAPVYGRVDLYDLTTIAAQYGKSAW